MNEFELIHQYFAAQTKQRSDVVCGIGDDGAIVSLAVDKELVITTDTLIAGVHFPDSTSPYDIGYKALAVNLSDLAAMGATPAWVTLALTLTQTTPSWIQSFCDGFFTLAHHHQIQLIGGDLTHGHLSITIQALGTLPKNQALMRSGAKATDLIYVTGTLGDAALGLQFLQKKISLSPLYQGDVLEKLNRPQPRITTGEYLRGIATSAIDISDGLAADLGHILEQSQVGAVLYLDQLPISLALQQTLALEQAVSLALTGGDDYELCFTIPKAKQNEAETKLSSLPCRFTCIGEITADFGLDLRYQDGRKYNGPIQGYQHF